MDDERILKETLSEINADFAGDIESFMQCLDERLEVGEYLNEKYKNPYMDILPVNTTYIEKQKEILRNMRNVNG